MWPFKKKIPDCIHEWAPWSEPITGEISLPNYTDYGEKHRPDTKMKVNMQIRMCKKCKMMEKAVIKCRWL